jgi:hypothetical protein
MAHDRFINIEQPQSICDFFLDAMEAHAEEQAGPDAEDVNSGDEFESDTDNNTDEDENSEEEVLLDI